MRRSLKIEAASRGRGSLMHRKEHEAVCLKFIMESDSRKYCEEMLPLVSRTFALGIGLLHDPLFIEVAVGYLICRITDTVEDTNQVSVAVRSDLLKKIACSLCKPGREGLLEEMRKAFPPDSFQGDEYELLYNTHKVMEIYDTLRENAKRFIQDCVFEMANGMALTVERENEGPLEGLRDEEDIAQYCYYVAGTVGKMLTRLFSEDRETIRGEVLERMKEREVDFGLGLQLTNILKGIFDDRERKVVYLPKTFFEKHRLTPERFFAAPAEEPCVEMMRSFIRFILPYLDQAVEYILLIPESEEDIRLFCALPVLFALRTLNLADQETGAFLRGEPLKITRKEVKELHLETSKCVGEDDRLLKLFKRERNF